MKQLAQFLKLFSDETRLRCIYLIYTNKSLCVCELTHALDLSQPKISRHLTSLRNLGVINDKRIGHWVYYSINDKLDKQQSEILTAIIDNVKSSQLSEVDVKRLNGMKNRPKMLNCC